MEKSCIVHHYRTFLNLLLINLYWHVNLLQIKLFSHLLF
jgi:hypothetical protein